MESKLINYEVFISKRPDMEVHTEVAITSCINSAYVLLDGECASLISQVDKYNMVEDRTTLDTNNVLYRTDFELGQLQEALVFQVQYVLNMGNDFTVGGGSYSIGNINSSYNRPEGRELIAPGVYKLLSNARVYHLNAFGTFDKNTNNEIPLSTSKEIMERVKNEYVAQNQPNAQVGQVAYINQSKQVDFGNPQDLQITTYNTNRVAGGEGFRDNYYEIDNVPNIAFFGNDLNGTYSAVHRQEMIDYINQNAGTDLAEKVAQIQQEQEEQNQAIESNTNEINTIKTDLGDLGNQVVDNRNEIARVDRVVNTNSTNIVNLDNKVNTNTNNINTNTTNITAVDSRLTNVSSLLNQTIDGLKTLKPFEYVGEYQQGNTYRINQAVSLNNNLYLSKEDNNTTTPPSNKWLLLNEDFASIDLTQYYTKLQVDSLINNVDNKVNTNTQKIQSIETNYWNKNDTNDADVKAGRVFLKQLFVGFTYNPNISSPYMLDAPGNNYLGDLEVDSINITTSSNTIDPTTPNSIANKHYVDNQNNNNVHLSGDQTINGTKTFNGTVRIERSGTLQNDGTTNLRVANINEASIVNGTLMNVGTASNSLVNKSYVDNAVANAGPNVPTDLVNRVQTLENDNTTNKANIATNTTNITNLNNQAVKTTGNQTIAGVKTFNNKITANAGLTTGTGQAITSENLELGFGSGIAYITPEDNSNKTLKFSGRSGHGRFDIDLENNCQLMGVKDPTRNYHAANKNYVDNKVSNPNIYQGTLDLVGTTPTSLVNKEYVDNAITNAAGIVVRFVLIYATGSSYSNLQSFIIPDLFSDPTIDYNKPLYISFQRSNAAKQNLGRYTGTIIYNWNTDDYYMVATQMYRNPVGSHNMEIGQMCGLLIQYKNHSWNAQVQCWDPGDRITDIEIKGWGA